MTILAVTAISFLALGMAPFSAMAAADVEPPSSRWRNEPAMVTVTPSDEGTPHRSRSLFDVISSRPDYSEGDLVRTTSELIERASGETLPAWRPLASTMEGEALRTVRIGLPSPDLSGDDLSDTLVVTLGAEGEGIQPCGSQLCADPGVRSLPRRGAAMTRDLSRTLACAAGLQRAVGAALRAGRVRHPLRAREDLWTISRSCLRAGLNAMPASYGRWAT